MRITRHKNPRHQAMLELLCVVVGILITLLVLSMVLGT